MGALRRIAVALERLVVLNEDAARRYAINAAREAEQADAVQEFMTRQTAALEEHLRRGRDHEQRCEQFHRRMAERIEEIALEKSVTLQ